jgi:DNA processing protein
LSLGTLVVEAALRSGSLITARMALEQNREVFAIPGSIGNPLARGCNSLIRQGAKLVETVDDILEELGAGFVDNGQSSSLPSVAPKPGGPESELLKYVAYDPTSVDTLVTATGMTPDAISSLLLILELQGHVVSLSGGCFCRTK